MGKFLIGKSKSMIPMNVLTYGKCILLLDTETITILKRGNIPYDISYIVYDMKNNKIIETGCMLNDFIYKNEDLIKKAYYYSNVKNGYYDFRLARDKKHYKIMKTKDILNKLNHIIDKYNISIVSAYNSAFDYEAINNLYDMYGYVKNNFKYLFQLDILNLFIKALETDQELREKYISFCKKNNYYANDKKINYSTKAEIVYRFIKDNIEYIETHTGLQDAYDELEILKYLRGFGIRYKLNTTINKSIYTNKNGLLRVS